jgi:hypothetical protein
MSIFPSPESYMALCSQPANNPFGPDEEHQELCYGAIYLVFRSTQAPLAVSVMLQNILADFSKCVGGMGMVIQYGNLETGVLQLVYGIQSYPGAPGRSRDRMRTFGYEGGVSGVDITTIDFDEEQLVILANMVMSGIM